MGESNIYHKIGNSYSEFGITVLKNDTTNFSYDGPIRLVNNALAFCPKEARLSTTIGNDIEHNKFCGQISTIMKVISNKDGDFLSQYVNENDIPVFERIVDLPSQFRDTPHQRMLINKHSAANKGKIKRYLFLEDFFGVLKLSKM